MTSLIYHVHLSTMNARSKTPVQTFSKSCKNDSFMPNHSKAVNTHAHISLYDSFITVTLIHRVEKHIIMWEQAI